MSKEEVDAWNLVEEISLNSSQWYHPRDLPTKKVAIVMEADHNVKTLWPNFEAHDRRFDSLHMVAINH